MTLFRQILLACAACTQHMDDSAAQGIFGWACRGRQEQAAGMHRRAHVALTFITVGFAGSLIKWLEETLENPHSADCDHI
jgi:hypothetical protein